MFKRLKNFLLDLKRNTKELILLFFDLILFCVSGLLASLSFDLSFYALSNLIIFLYIAFTSIITFYKIGVYKLILRYIDLSVINVLLTAIFISFAINIVSFEVLKQLVLLEFLSMQFQISTIVVIAVFLISTFFIIGSRLWANYYFSDKISSKKVLIYGAGSAGMQLAGALRISKEMEPICFVDQKSSLHSTFVGGLKIYHPKEIERLIDIYSIEEVLIAMPSVSKSNLNKLLREIENFPVKVRILPGLSELAQGKISVSELKEIDILDLLGRLEIDANKELLEKNIKYKNILVTGAGGSIGSEIAKQISNLEPNILILVDSNEYSLYSVHKELKQLEPELNIKSLIANVMDKERIKRICNIFNVNTIYHAAAYKHVPMVEENPFEAFNNNVLGTKICAEVAMEAKVETFVLISTDKAVRPTNIMGATKRFSEMVLQSFSADNKQENITRMSMVRFGNVLGSSGSAIPLFQKQIRSGGPVTVTHPEIIRYFMSIPEAAELVIQAGAMGKGGEVFVLDMGQPLKVLDLAKRLITLSGMTVKDYDNPDGEIEIVFTGLRPGEKLFEELLIGNDSSETLHKKILVANEPFLNLREIENFISIVNAAETVNDVALLKSTLAEAVQGYQPMKEIVDPLYITEI